MKMTVKSPGFGGVIASLQRKQRNIKPTKGTYGKATAAWLGWIKRNIDAKGALHARFSWPGLKESTKAAKRRRGQSENAMLIGETGNLRRKWDQKISNRGGTLTSLAAVKGGKGTPYAWFHETGEGTVPRRKILPDEKQALEIVFPIFQAQVRIGVKT